MTLQNIAARAFSNGQQCSFVDKIAQLCTRHVAITRDLVRRQGLPIDGAIVCCGNVWWVDKEDAWRCGSVDQSVAKSSISATEEEEDFGQQLIEGLLAFVVVPKAGEPRLGQGVKFVNEHSTTVYYCPLQQQWVMICGAHFVFVGTISRLQSDGLVFVAVWRIVRKLSGKGIEHTPRSVRRKSSMKSDALQAMNDAVATPASPTTAWARIVCLASARWSIQYSKTPRGAIPLSSL